MSNGLAGCRTLVAPPIMPPSVSGSRGRPRSRAAGPWSPPPPRPRTRDRVALRVPERLSRDGAPLRHRWDPRCRGMSDLKPTLACARPGHRPSPGLGPGGALVVGQDTRRSGDMFVAAIAAGAASLGAEVQSIVGVVPTPALAHWREAGRSRPGSWCRPRTTRPTTTDSRCSMARRAQARRLDRGRARAADLALRGPRRRRPNAALGRILASPPTSWRTTAPAPSGGARPSVRAMAPIARRGQRVGIGARARDPAGDRRDGGGHPRRAGRDQHQRPLGRDRAGLAGGGGRRARAPTSGSRSTATPTG